MRLTSRLGATPRPVQDLAVAATFAGVYLLVAELTRSLGPTDPALLWAPSGLYVGVLIVSARRLWPLLVCAALAASFGANLLAGHSLTVSLAFAVPSGAEGLLGALVVMRLAKGRFSLGRLRDVAALILGAAVVANGLTALSAAAATAQAFDASFAESWLQWWSAHALGIVVVCPILVSLIPTPPRLPARARLAEVALVAAGLTAIVVFLSSAEPLGAATVVAGALALPLLFWTSWRSSPREAALAALAPALAAAYLAPRTVDPLGLGGIASSEIVVAQVFLATFVIASLAFAAAAAERREAAGIAELARRRLRDVVGTAPDAYVSIDDAGLITAWSPRAETVLGWTREEALGRRLHETVVPASGRAAWMAEVERRAATDGPGVPVPKLAALHKDGRELPVELTISPSSPEALNATHLFIRDVSERERLRDELREAGELLTQRAAELARTEERATRLADGLSRRSEELQQARDVARRELDAVGSERERLQAELANADQERAAASVAAERDRRGLEEVTERLAGERLRLERALDAMVMSFAEADRERMLLARRATELILRYDRLGICRYASPACLDLLGYEPSELVGNHGAELLHDDDRPCFERAREAESATTFGARLLRKDGALAFVEATLAPVRDPATGKLVAVEASVRRMPDEMEAPPRRRVSQARFDATFGKAPTAMALLERDGAIRKANPALCRLSGYSREQLETMRLRKIMSPDEHAGFDAALLQLAAGERSTLRFEQGLVRADGHVLRVNLSVSTVQDRKNQPVELVAHVQDLSENVQARDELRRLADHDPLTGLYSHGRFEEELRTELAAARRYGTHGAVLVANLDGFTTLNGLLGRAHGDGLIRGVAYALRQRLRSTDVAGRTAGGQFAVLLRRADGPEATEVANALLDAVREVGRAGPGEQLGLTASIGIATFGNDRAVRAEELLVESEIAVQDAKQGGGDRAMTYDPVRERPVTLGEGFGWADQIRAALADDRFKLYAEPVLSLAGDHRPRHELLPSMESASGELVPPAAFLPAAERFGLAGEIDRWLLRSAIEVLAREGRDGSGARLEVSLSTKAPADPDLHSFVDQQLRAAGADPAGLCIAIAETAAIHGTDRTSLSLRRLADLGCELGLDRFGAGVASFLHVERLPVGYVKFDGALVDRLAAGESARLVVKAIADVAHGLGMRTVASHVSDEPTLRLLRGLGVGYAQGAALAPARPVTGLQLSRPPAVPRA